MLALLTYSLIISTSNFIPKKDIQSFVYHLELENKFHYVGITKNLNQRWSQHVAGKGAKWTQLHKPKKIVDFWTNGNEEMENKKTYELMDKYGIDKVRGGVCHCPILKDCEKFGCKYTSNEDKEFKIIQEYYNLLKKDWVQELINVYINNNNRQNNKNRQKNYNIVDELDKIRLIENKWYYNSVNDINRNNRKQVNKKQNNLKQIFIDEHNHIVNFPSQDIIQHIYNWENGKLNTNNNMFLLFTNYLYLKMMNKT